MPGSGEIAMKKTDKLLFSETSLSHKRARQWTIGQQQEPIFKNQGLW